MKRESIESPCGRFGIAVEPSHETEELYIVDHYVDNLFFAEWHKDGNFYELHIEFYTAMEFTPGVADLDPSDYLQGVEYGAAIEYNDELRNFLPPPMFKELERLLMAYRMELL